MPITATAALLLLQAAPPAPVEIRSVVVSVTDEEGGPVRSLVPEEVAIIENGVARDLTRFEPDRRALTVAVLLDSSEEVSASFRLHLVDAVTSFLGRLPEGSRYALWTTGDRPTKIVDFTDNVSEAPRRLRRVFPQGGNTVLDALVEASRDLKTQEGDRSGVVAITGLGIEFSARDRRRVVEEAEQNASVFMCIQFEEGTADFARRANYEYVLGNLARRTGGLHEALLSAMGVRKALEKVAADLGGRYRLSYASLPAIKERRLEVKVARPGVRVRLGPSVARNP